jgi:RNA polymerase sigma factor (sigma-70 family)
VAVSVEPTTASPKEPDLPAPAVSPPVSHVCHNASGPRVLGPRPPDGSAVDFDAVFARLHPSLFRYLHRLTGEQDVAEDIAQEAFVRLLRQSLPEAEVRPWLFTVATNLVRDRARKSERRQRLLMTAPDLVTRTPLPDEDVERAERRQSVRNALDRLPQRDRQLLLMREEGFKYDEIAQVIGVASASVGTLIARALKKFVAEYEAREFHDEPRN